MKHTYTTHYVPASNLTLRLFPAGPEAVIVEVDTWQGLHKDTDEVLRTRWTLPASIVAAIQDGDENVLQAAAQLFEAMRSRS